MFSELVEKTKDFYKKRDLIYKNLCNEYKNIGSNDSDSDCSCDCCQVDKKIQKKYKKQLLDLIIKYEKSLSGIDKIFYTFSEISIIVLGFLNFLNEMPAPMALTTDIIFNTELNNQNIQDLSIISWNYDKTAIEFAIGFSTVDSMNKYSYDLAMRCVKIITNIIEYYVYETFVRIGDEHRFIKGFSFDEVNDGQLFFKMEISDPLTEEELDCEEYYKDILSVLKNDKRIYENIFDNIKKFICK